METFRIYKEMEVTYAELSRALTGLGFQDLSTEKEFRFENPAFNCTVSLPPKRPNVKLLKAYFASYSLALEACGVLENAHDLARLIEKERFGLPETAAAR